MLSAARAEYAARLLRWSAGGITAGYNEEDWQKLSPEERAIAVRREVAVCSCERCKQARMDAAIIIEKERAQ